MVKKQILLDFLDFLECRVNHDHLFHLVVPEMMTILEVMLDLNTLQNII